MAVELSPNVFANRQLKMVDADLTEENVNGSPLKETNGFGCIDNECNKTNGSLDHEVSDSNDKETSVIDDNKENDSRTINDDEKSISDVKPEDCVPELETTQEPSAEEAIETKIEEVIEEAQEIETVSPETVNVDTLQTSEEVKETDVLVTESQETSENLKPDTTEPAAEESVNFSDTEDVESCGEDIENVCKDINDDIADTTLPRVEVEECEKRQPSEIYESPCAEKLSAPKVTFDLTPGPSGSKRLDTPYPYSKISGRRPIRTDLDNSFAVRSEPSSPAFMSFPGLRRFGGEEALNVASEENRKRPRSDVESESPASKRAKSSWIEWVNPLRWIRDDGIKTDLAEIAEEHPKEVNELAVAIIGNDDKTLCPKRSCNIM